MELNSTIKAHISDLLSDPAKTRSADVDLLVQLAAAYPYFKPAHLLLARASQTTETLEKAAIYSNGPLCYRIMHEETFGHENAQGMADDQEIFEEIAEFVPVADLNAPEASDDQFTNQETPHAGQHISEEPEEEILHWELTDNKPVMAAPEIETVTPDEPEHAPVSKYDDENLPYTFLWWLAKTRAEHQQLFQPYAAPKKQQSGELQQQSGALQQQYVEHIFHLQTGLGENRTMQENGEGAHFHKEEVLINAFLEKDPQIKPPPVDKLDTENKARKSAEDHNDVVSETLAAIYIEQMLYRKAIDTYEKLSLKFPEKSRYFADLIKSLEKKI